MRTIVIGDVHGCSDELGQLLDHTGPVAASERNAARIFNADHCFFVTNGTSTSNKMVWHANVAPGDIVVVRLGIPGVSESGGTQTSASADRSSQALQPVIDQASPLSFTMAARVSSTTRRNPNSSASARSACRSGDVSNGFVGVSQ